MELYVRKELSTDTISTFSKRRKLFAWLTGKKVLLMLLHILTIHALNKLPLYVYILDIFALNLYIK